jgi:acetyl-CoA acetyltransferase
MTEASVPIIAGVAQYTQRRDAERPLDPLGLMARVCWEAMDDAGPEGLQDIIDEVHVVNLFQWPYLDAPGMLCERLGMSPRACFYTPIGGNTPQLLVNRACRALAEGSVRAVLITGAEAIYSIRRALKGNVVLDWPETCAPVVSTALTCPG